MLELRALDRSVEEIAAELTLAGTPVSGILALGGIMFVDDATPSEAGAPGMVRTKLRDVQPNSPDVRTIHASSPAAASDRVASFPAISARPEVGGR